MYTDLVPFEDEASDRIAEREARITKEETAKLAGNSGGAVLYRVSCIVYRCIVDVSRVFVYRVDGIARSTCLNESLV
jgi:hypothetical protein